MDTSKVTVVLYSSNAQTRREVKIAVGTRPNVAAPEITWVECATPHAATAAVAIKPRPALAIADGEATPLGGLGWCRQVKDEVYDCPPVVALTARVDDGWLAHWSGADAVVNFPGDPMVLARTIADFLLTVPAATSKLQ